MSQANHDQAKAGKCAATMAGSIWECERCALAWEDGDKPPACLALTYERLIDLVVSEAHRIESTQRALVAVGDRERRHQGELGRAMAFRALVKLIAKVRDAKGAAA